MRAIFPTTYRQMARLLPALTMKGRRLHRVYSAFSLEPRFLPLVGQNGTCKWSPTRYRRRPRGSSVMWNQTIRCSSKETLRECTMADNIKDDTTVSVAQRVQTILENSPVLQPLELVHVTDFSDGVCHGAKLEVTVVSDAAFTGKLPLARHRIVNECLESLLADETIHALTLKTWTTKQYEAKK